MVDEFVSRRPRTITVVTSGPPPDVDFAAEAALPFLLEILRQERLRETEDTQPAPGALAKKKAARKRAK